MEKDFSKIERHPFTPFLPEGCKVVLCGTFPPKQNKWSMDFFYPNFQNDMWRIFGNIFYKDKDRFFNKEKKTIDKAGIQQMLIRYKIGIGETATEVVRLKENASDKFLEIITPVNLTKLFSNAPYCEVIATTGEKAASVIASLTNTEIPKMGEHISCSAALEDGSKRDFIHWRCPSTSRAYPMALEKKEAYYREMLSFAGIIK
ncbi:MAG: uracil-DNA glycosylase family protein [Muribaculaceae bacterium]|nr:uracil-DNA glycosylase family protein [Muribaculaceae bacterium]